MHLAFAGSVRSSTRPVETRQNVGCWRVRITSKSFVSQLMLHVLGMFPTGAQSGEPPPATAGIREQYCGVRLQTPVPTMYSQCACTWRLLVLVSLMIVSRVPSAITFGQITTEPGRSDTTSAPARVPHSAMAASTTPRLNSQGIRFCTPIARLLSVTAPFAHQGPEHSPMN